MYVCICRHTYTYIRTLAIMSSSVALASAYRNRVPIRCISLSLSFSLSQAMRTAAAMAHAAVLHVLDIFRNYRHRLDAEWSQGSLRGANTFSLEGLHSEARTGSVSKATDQNWTVAG